MAHSNIDIANAALRLAGGSRITDLDQDGKSAAVTRDLIFEVRDELLGSANWHFARSRQKLSRDSTAPISGYSYAYTLPADWIKTREVYDNDADAGSVDFQEEDHNGVGSIMASAEDLYLVYTKEVIDPNRMTSLFRSAWEAALGQRISPSIANSNTKFVNLDGLAQRLLIKAQSSDAQGGVPRPKPAGSWVNSRFGRQRISPR